MGGIGQIDATLALLRYAKERGPFDEYCLLSGQDFPIVPADELVLKIQDKTNYINFTKSKNNNGFYNNFDKRTDLFFPKLFLKNTFLSRFLKRIYIEITGGYSKTFNIFKRKNISFKTYFGSQWFCISDEFLSWINEYLNNHPEYYMFYENVVCPDESFFQTLFMLSPFCDKREDSLHYICWEKNKNNPKNLTEEDFINIKNSGKLFCRKIDGCFGLIEILKQ